MDAPIVPSVPVAPVAPTSPVSKAPAVDSKPSLSASADAKSTADTKAADAIKATTPAEKAVIQKIKVGDTEYDETTLKSMIEKSKGADKKFLEAAQARKEAMRFFKLAKENPREFLEKTGVDPKKFSYDEVAKDIQDKLRDPKEVELERAQERLKQYETKEADAKAKLAKEKLDNETKAMEQRFHAEIIDALEGAPSIPKNGFSVAKIAKYIETVYNKTQVLLPAKEVVGVIERDIRSEMGGIIKGASAEQLMELIGEEGMAAIRAHDLAKLKNPLNNPNGSSGSPKKTEEHKPMRSRDVWKAIDDAAKEEGYNKFGQRIK